MLAYLAAPYSHPDPEVVDARMVALAEAAAWLDRRGTLVLAPALHWHPVCRMTGLPGTWGSRRPWCLAALKACGSVLVLTLEGWSQSEGVLAELREAAHLKMPISHLDPGVIS